MFGGVRNLDERIRGYMAQQAEEQLAARRKAVMDDLVSQAQSNPERAAQRVSQSFVGANGKRMSDEGVSGIENLLRTGMNTRTQAPGNARSMLESAAAREAEQNPLYNLQSMLAGTGAGNRAGQVAFYGAATGGAAAGLTAAGQGLVALMDYIQQGTEAQSEREKPLG